MGIRAIRPQRASITPRVSNKGGVSCEAFVSSAVTRLSDRPDPVPDEIWEEAARHYDEKALAALITAIALINVWNRLNVATAQVAGEWAKSAGAGTSTEKSRSAAR